MKSLPITVPTFLLSVQLQCLKWFIWQEDNYVHTSALRKHIFPCFWEFHLQENGPKHVLTKLRHWTSLSLNLIQEPWLAASGGGKLTCSVSFLLNLQLSSLSTKTNKIFHFFTVNSKKKKRVIGEYVFNAFLFS